ncbi:YbhB/YbcL family Raf kinase inhibitor-like protein [Sphingomonas glaciei]|uniref:YbhB/YbcL family Raf kinase inhibitor-like protein n=1 Tax=Sphingomonas glaciei TaxID=2938948 RepID=A0ABY5MV96_9SPHN|nr:YbhB/YbcL family Raf kinase inhibitor-like protein [Sphingomonas glaciei]UUR07354.1 YbhB/YbcL family Raf kinase inhibitor-like protein [Sphingomonas glaciei]
MLENIPHWLGAALSGVRAGHDKLTLSRLDLAGAASLELSSPAFASGGRLPPRFTADGEGVSPPLVWRGVPEGTDCLALIVEDADAPAPRPLVHAIVVAIDPALDGLPEGAIAPDGDGAGGKDVGMNSYFAQGWLPPDPPTGHGAHDYVFQLLALRRAEGSEGDPADEASPGRGEFVDLVRDRILAAGVLVGTYSRGEEVPVGPVGGANPLPA